MKVQQAGRRAVRLRQSVLVASRCERWLTGIPAIVTYPEYGQLLPAVKLTWGSSAIIMAYIHTQSRKDFIFGMFGCCWKNRGFDCLDVSLRPGERLSREDGL